MARGYFVSLEGIEGSGKSTQAHLLVERLREHGAAVLALREPGGTAIGEGIRGILLDRHHETMTPETEALLYAAARAQMVHQELAPALARGQVVVCDRFVDSSIAYQCFGRGLAREFVYELNHWATRATIPDITVLLDVTVDLGLARATRTGCDRIESESLEFHERVRQGYLALAQDDPDRVIAIDASGPPEAVAERVQSIVLEGLRQQRAGAGD